MDDITKPGLIMYRGPSDFKNPNKGIVYVRDLAEDEINLLISTNKFLSELTSSSPYMSFQNKSNHFEEYFNQLNADIINRSVNTEKLNKIFSLLDDLLSSLKGFEDRTKNIISDRYGKDSDVMRVFKAALSYEFDNMFEYRFSYNLRNYSQHKGSQVGEIKSNAELVNGKPVGYVKVVLDSDKLLESYDKWHSSVKKDLEGMKSKFELADVISKLKYSCFRIYSKYLIAQETEIIKKIEDFQKIIGKYDPEIEAPHILRLDKDFSKKGGKMILTPIKVNLIDTINEILPSARHYSGLE